jgi:hypothetical protein
MEKLSSKKSRPWEIKDLYNRIAPVRAVPILFLEKWEREKGSPGSDRMTTDEINNELVTISVNLSWISGAMVDKSASEV